jgi:hypothetical protein
MRTLARGVLGEINQSGGLTVGDLYRFVEQGRSKVLVPIDQRVSPWIVPKFFTLSTSQALTLMDAIERDQSLHLKIEYLLRADGTIALIRREDDHSSDDGVHVRQSGEVP